MPISWSRLQALTRRNISRHRPAEESAVGVGEVGVVVQGEDGEKGGMGKWMWTRVRKAVGPLCGLFVWFNTPITGAKLANDTTDQCTSLVVQTSLYIPRFSTSVYRYC